MSNSSSLTSTVAQRYAGSLFDLAKEAKNIEAVEKELATFSDLIHQSDDLKRLIFSPVFSTEEQLVAIAALSDKLGYKGDNAKGLVGNFLRVVAENRRLFVLPSIIEAFHHLAAQERGEVTAAVVSAHELTGAQEKELKAALKAAMGKDVRLNVSVDPAILGGLIVRVGSYQIDTSLITKLNSLKLALKEVG